MLLLGLMLAGVLAVPLAHEAASQEDDPFTWDVRRTDGGCHVILFASGWQRDPIHWDGACDEDGLITGPGNLWTDGPPHASGKRTTANAGLLDGPYQMWRADSPNFTIDGVYQSGCMDGDGNCTRNPRGGEALRRRFQAEARARRAEDAPAGSEAVGQCELTPEQARDRFVAQYEQERRDNPLPASAGARDNYQYAYALGTRGLVLIEPYRQCMGQYFTPNYNALTGMRDQGRTGCEQLSTSAASCTPEYPRAQN